MLPQWRACILLQAVKGRCMCNNMLPNTPLGKFAGSLCYKKNILLASSSVNHFHATHSIKSSNTSDPERVRPIEDIPGPKAVPVFGTMLPQLKNLGRLYEFMNDQAKKFGGIYREKPGPIYSVILSDANFIQNFYQREEKLPHRAPIEPWKYWKEKRGKKLGIFLM